LHAKRCWSDGKQARKLRQRMKQAAPNANAGAAAGAVAGYVQDPNYMLEFGCRSGNTGREALATAHCRFT